MAMLSLDVIQILDYNIFCTMCRCSSVVEQRIRNARVGGSNPLSGSIRCSSTFELQPTYRSISRRYNKLYN